MQLIEVKTKKEKKMYIDFIYKVYENDRNFSDMNLIFVKKFLYKKDHYAKRVNVIPIMIEDNGIKLVCMFINSEYDKELKLSFLEFMPNAKEYIQVAIDYGKKLMKKYGLTKMVIGVNGQISYGLGILVKGHNDTFEFNSNYNPDYYVKELDEIIETKKRAFSYKYDASKTLGAFEQNSIKHIYDNYDFRFLNKRKFKKEMLTFGKLCHDVLKETPYYNF